MPRARRRPSAPSTTGQTGISPSSVSARRKARVDALVERRGALMLAGADMADIVALDRQITEARRALAGDAGQASYARRLARARRRGAVRDRLALIAVYVPELTPALIEAADVYRLACGVDAGWAGCRMDAAVGLEAVAGDLAAAPASSATDIHVIPGWAHPALVAAIPCRAGPRAGARMMPRAAGWPRHRPLRQSAAAIRARSPMAGWHRPSTGSMPTGPSLPVCCAPGHSGWKRPGVMRPSVRRRICWWRAMSRSAGCAGPLADAGQLSGRRFFSP